MDQMSGGPVTGQDTELVKDLSLPLFQAKGWLRFLGVMMIITGIFYALTLVGIIVCWLPIWMGVLLFKAAGAIEVAQMNGDRVQFQLALGNLKTFITIMGVLMLISIVLGTISLLITGGSLLGALSTLN